MTMNFPGGPGIPCGTPVFDVSRPLASVPAANRGASKELYPSENLATDPFARTERQVVDARTGGCVIAEALVVTLGRRPLRLANGPRTPESLTTLLMPRVRAHLTWGVGGSAALDALVDWIHGTQITISAEYAQVSAIYDVVTEPWAPATIDPCELPTFEVSAGVGYGSISVNSNPARLTEIVQLHNPGDTQMIPIPAFAVSFSVFVLGDTEAVQVKQAAFGTAYNTLHDFGAPSDPSQYRVENAIPIWNGAESG